MMCLRTAINRRLVAHAHCLNGTKTTDICMLPEMTLSHRVRWANTSLYRHLRTYPVSLWASESSHCVLETMSKKVKVDRPGDEEDAATDLPQIKHWIKKHYIYHGKPFHDSSLQF